jgi:hypothetical protein
MDAHSFGVLRKMMKVPGAAAQSNIVKDARHGTCHDRDKADPVFP